MAIKKGLGRGFDSLIPTQLLNDAFDPTAELDAKASNYKQVATDAIAPDPEQPRRHFDEDALQELANSIMEHGVLLPLVVTKQGDQYQIVAGERRWRAAKLAGVQELPVIVRTVTAQHKLELSLIENLQRKDLNPLETATAYLKLHQQFNLTYEQIGQRVGGKAFSTISNVMRLLNLPQAAKDALVEKKISEGHARQILAIDKPNIQQQLLDLILKNDWSVRKTEQFVTGYKESGKKKSGAVAKTRTQSAETQKLAKRLSAPVQIKAMAKGGQLIIRYTSDDELARIYRELL